MDQPKTEKQDAEMAVYIEASKEQLENASDTPNDEAQVAIEKALRHKFDRRILPLGIIIYLMAQIDRSNMSNALVLGIREDADLTGDRFNISLTLFYVTYILFEIPANMCCKRFGPRIWLSFITFGFGVTTACMSLCKDYPSIMTCRLILGIFEAGVQPGLMFVYAQFYRRQELGSRWGIKAAAGSVAGAFGGLLGSGLGNIPKAGMFERWRWIFLIEGIITALVAGLVYWFMPKDVAFSSFLTAEERRIAVHRIAEENKASGAAEDVSPWRLDVLKKAMINANTQLVGLGIMMSLLSLTSLSLFMVSHHFPSNQRSISANRHQKPSLIRSMGYSTTHAQLLTVPPYVLAACVCIGASFASDRLRSRGLIIMALTPLTAIGFLLLAFVPSTAVRYFALFLTTAPAFTCSPLLLTWVVGNAAGPSVRAIVSAYAVGEGNVGAIIATWTFLPSEGPRYLKGHLINFGGSFVLLVVVIFTHFYLKWENKERARGKRDYRLANVTDQEKWQLGHQNPEFKYMT